MRAAYEHRELNENLNPLRRHLRTQVDRPCSKVFSEICATIDRRNTVQQHIHQHIDQFIAPPARPIQRLRLQWVCKTADQWNKWRYILLLLDG
jgi:hypothetical protein